MGIRLFGRWIIFAIVMTLLALPSMARDVTYVNNEIALEIRVERGGRLWSLAEVPSLRYGDFLHVKLVNAKGFNKEFPYVINQRLNSMPSNHGLMLVGAFVRATDRSGLGLEAFPRPFLSADNSELLFRIERDDVTPFLLLIPAIYEGREGEWEDFVKDITRKPELKAFRDFLLREFDAGTAGGEIGMVYKEGDDPDSSLRTAQFLLPRIMAANQERNAPDYNGLSRSQQTDRLYGALGVAPPPQAGSLEYINSFLDAFVPTDPTQPVKMPDRNTFGALLQQGVSFLPQWYSAPLRGLELFGKMTLLLSGLNQRPKRDEKYFVSVRWAPKTATPATPGAAGTVAGSILADTYQMDPIERLDAKGADGRGRKNILIACLGRTGFKKAVIKPTIAVPNQGGIVYLSNTSQTRILTFDGASPLSPDQLERFTSGLVLQLMDGSPAIPLTYDKKNGAFILASAQTLPLKPVNAVIRGDWGHTGRVDDLTTAFQVCGVDRGLWTVENGLSLTVGGQVAVRLRTEKPIRPYQVTFRYTNGAPLNTQDIAEVPNEPGVYTAKFDLTGQRAGIGRLEIYKPPMGDAPDMVEGFRDATSGDLRVQLFDPQRPIVFSDLEYYAYDNRLKVKGTAFTENTAPARIAVGESVFERGPNLEEGWIAYDTKTPFTKVGSNPAMLTLRDGRITTSELRVRPRRPTFTMVERIKNNPPAPFPWELPEKLATQYSALEIRLTAAEGYRFVASSQLMFGPIAIKPDIIPTGAQGVEMLTFTLDPRLYPNLRGALVGRLTETRDSGETVTSADLPLAYTLAQLPDLPISLRVMGGKYRLIGNGVGSIERAGAASMLQPVMPTGTGPTAYIDFTVLPGAPLVFQARGYDTPLRWNGPIVPASLNRPAIQLDNGDKPAAMVQWNKAEGATEYRVFRSTDPNVPATPQTRLTVLPATDAATYAYADKEPLEPGAAYYYRVVAVCRKDGYTEDLFPEAEFSAVSAPSEAILVRPAAPLTVAVAAVMVNDKTVPEIRFSKAAGATAYRIYRGESTDFMPTPENKVSPDLAATAPDTQTWQDAAPLTPGRTYFYKVIAIATREGIKEAVSAPSPVSNGYLVP